MNEQNMHESKTENVSKQTLPPVVGIIIRGGKLMKKKKNSVQNVENVGVGEEERSKDGCG